MIGRRAGPRDGGSRRERKDGQRLDPPVGRHPEQAVGVGRHLVRPSVLLQSPWAIGQDAGQAAQLPRIGEAM